MDKKLPKLPNLGKRKEVYEDTYKRSAWYPFIESINLYLRIEKLEKKTRGL